VLEQGGVTVVVDPQSAQYLRGAKVNYIEDFRGAGFAVENPNATGGCGCGKSFNA
jgi:iron-sulfur cluster assembly accessory protein